MICYLLPGVPQHSLPSPPAQMANFDLLAKTMVTAKDPNAILPGEEADIESDMLLAEKGAAKLQKKKQAKADKKAEEKDKKAVSIAFF